MVYLCNLALTIEFTPHLLKKNNNATEIYLQIRHNLEAD